MRVIVIGCGPSGLAAAWAARGLGCAVEVYAPKRAKSQLLGPLLLQRPIPGITVTHPDGYIAQHVVGGSILDYRYKLYGDINIGINGDVLERGYHAWRLGETYDLLWREFYPFIHEVRVTPAMLQGLTAGERDPLIINTARADQFCLEPMVHQFVSKSVAIVNDQTAIDDQPDNTIYFNADPGTPWVRSSHIFGNKVVEYPLDQAPADSMRIRKPISTTCDCHPKALRAGRYGAWRNETWVDTAYYATREALLVA